MHNLKKKVTEYIREYDISTSQFEKIAGVSNAVVNRILDESVKNPSIETILKIADVLGCSLDELFDRNHYKGHLTNQTEETHYDNELFRSICLHVVHFIEINRVDSITFNKVETVIEEIYKYCLDKSLVTVDIKFANWFLKNNLLN